MAIADSSVEPSLSVACVSYEKGGKLTMELSSSRTNKTNQENIKEKIGQCLQREVAVEVILLVLVGTLAPSFLIRSRLILPRSVGTVGVQTDVRVRILLSFNLG